MMSPEMIETARLLMAHPKCPEGLVLHVVSKGVAVEEYACPECGEEMLEDVGVCPECGCDGWTSTVTYPNPDTVPALGDSHGGLANVGPLLVALCGWEVATPTCSGGAWSALHVLAGRACMAHTPAHLAALALLAVPR